MIDPLMTMTKGEERIEAEVGMTETGPMTGEDLMVTIGITNVGGDKESTTIDQAKYNLV